MRIRRSGAVTGWAALRLHGANFFDGLARDGRTRLPVPIAAGPDRLEPHPDITRSREPLDPADVVLRHGVRCADVHRALFDEMRRLGERREAAVAMDMAAAAELTSISRMKAYVGTRAGWTDVGLVRSALELADEDSRSPAESRLRMVWQLDAGWARPLCNRPVFDLEGRLLGVPDLLGVELGIVGEFDGADHRDIARHRRDVRREDGFRRSGLEYFEVVGADLWQPPLVVDRMEATRARAGRTPRRWTIERPHSFPSRPSLDERLDLRDLMQRDLEGPPS